MTCDPPHMLVLEAAPRFRPILTPAALARPKPERGAKGYRVLVRRKTESYLQRVLSAERLNTWGEAAERLLAEAALRDLLLEPVEIDLALAAKKKKGGTGNGTWCWTRTVYVRVIPPVERFLARHDPAIRTAASAYLEALRMAEEAGR